MSNRSLLSHLSIITASTLLLTFLVWFPHILGLHSFFNLDFSAGFNVIYRNFDGLEYVVIAKSFYNPQMIDQFPYHLPSIYYSTRFPMFPILIVLFAPLVGYLKSMLLVTVLFTILSASIFYLLIRDFKLSNQPLFLSLAFLLLPARWLIVHSVGSAEPIFIFFITASLYTFMKYEATKKAQWILLASLAGVGAQLTKSPGVLLFISYGIYLLWSWYQLSFQPKQLIRIVSQYWTLLLIPLSLIGIFSWYATPQAYGDFFAYFKSGDNIHLTFPPYQIFNKHQYWVGDMWLEDVVYIFLLGFLGGILLLKDKLKPLGIFVLTFLIATIFVAHRDISRYVMPIFPFLLIAFAPVITRKEFKIALVLVGLGIYLYSQNFIIENVAPIANVELYN